MTTALEDLMLQRDSRNVLHWYGRVTSGKHAGQWYRLDTPTDASEAQARVELLTVVTPMVNAR